MHKTSNATFTEKKTIKIITLVILATKAISPSKVKAIQIAIIINIEIHGVPFEGMIFEKIFGSEDSIDIP